MPSSVDLHDLVSLSIAGREHRDWERYEVDSDLLTPADGWRVSLGLPDGKVPDYVAEWAPVTLSIAGQVIMRGRIDAVEDVCAKGEHTLALTGRDLAGVLVDCSAPVFTARQCGLDEIVAKMVRPLGISSIQVDAGPSNGKTRHEKISVDPGMSAWDALQQVCEKNGCWPYVAPDGTLVIGGPDYTAPPVGTLIMRRDGKGNNVLRLARRRTIQDRYSEVTVLGQSHGTERAEGGHNIRATAKDSAVDWYRPKIVVEADCDSAAHASRRARKIVSDGCLAGLDLVATVRGHRVTGPNSKPGSGVLWMPGQRVRVLSEPMGLDAVYYLMRRTFLGSRAGGQTTELGLKLDGMWQPDVGHHRKHKAKQGQAGGRVVDL